MSLYKWMFKKLTGIELVEPSNTARFEENDAELFLSQKTSWPQKVSGQCFIIDSTGDDMFYFYWAIAQFKDERFRDSILVEFQQDILVKTKLAHKEEFPEQLYLWVNPAINEYYQVIDVEQI